MKYILVDTCIWIDFFKDSDNILSDRLQSIISEDRVLLSDVIRAELLVGARSNKELEVLNSVFGGLKIARIDSQIFLKAGQIGFSMRRSGYSLPLTDLLITAQAIHHNASIWTFDKHFDLLDKKMEFDLIYQFRP